MPKFTICRIFAIIIFFCFSCEEFCEESNRTAVVVNFYDSAGELLKVKVAMSGIENDSLLYNGQTVSQVLLPINAAADSMRYTLKNDTFPVDTIILRYKRHIGFISSECGCVAFAEIEGEPEITRNTVTNIIVNNPNVKTVSYREGVVNAENIKIYY